MWRIRGRTPRLLLAVALWFLPQSQAQHKLSAPVNLSITSHDFHTVLKWDVLNARTTWFNVDFCDYETAHWKPLCVNISKCYCDLSNAFVATRDLTSGYYTRVAAVTASQVSTFAHTNRFTFRENATLGPPVVQLSAYGNDLTVEVKYPVHNSTSHNVPFNLLSYNVHYRVKDNPKQGYLKMTPRQPLKQFKVQEGIICVSAEVRLKRFDLKGKRSEETCLRINLSNLPDSTMWTWPSPLKIVGNITSHTNELDNLVQGEEEYTNYQEDEYDYLADEYDYPAEGDEDEYLQENERYLLDDDGEKLQYTLLSVVIPIVLAFVVLVILTSAVIYMLKCKKKLVLPKSLAHIILNEKSCNVLNLKTEESSVCILEQLEEVSNNPEINRNHEEQEEVINSLDNVDPDTINADGGSNELIDADWTDPYAAKIDINDTDQKTVCTENIEVGINDLDSNHDLCKTHFDSTKENYTADHWGYDKPQIPINMLN